MAAIASQFTTFLRLLLVCFALVVRCTCNKSLSQVVYIKLQGNITTYHKVHVQTSAHVVQIWLQIASQHCKGQL